MSWSPEENPETAAAPQPVRALKALGECRRRLRSLFLAEGLLALGLSIFGAGAILFTLDYFLGLPRGVRALALAASAAYLLLVFARKVLQASRRPLSIEDMAILIERKNPQLKQSLVTAVQLGRSGGGRSRGGRVAFAPARHLSAPLIASVVQEVESRLDQMPLEKAFENVVDRKPLYRSGALLAAFAAAVLCGAAFRSDLFGIWLRRTFLLSAERWPKNVQLALVSPAGSTVTIALGEDLPVEVRAVRGQVSSVEIRYAAESGAGARTELMRETSEGAFRRVFESVTEPFSFQVRGGDDELEPVEVKVQIRPKITHLEIWCRYPEHTGKESTPETEPLLNGHLKVPEGTEVRYRAYTDVPVRKAFYQFLSKEAVAQESRQRASGDRPSADRPSADRPSGAGAVPGPQPATDAGGAPGVEAASPAEPVWPPPGAQELEIREVRGPADIHSLARRQEAIKNQERLPPSVFAGSFTVAMDGYYSFHLQGRNDFINQKPVRYKVQAILDRKPEVRVQEPMKNNEEVSPEALVRIRVKATDDYGLKDGKIDGLHIPAAVAAAPPGGAVPQGGDAPAPVPVILPLAEFSAEDPRQARKEALAEAFIDVGKLKAVKGDRIKFTAVAGDFGGNTGSSEPYYLQISGKEDILNILRGRLNLVRDVIQTAIGHQESARKDLQSYLEQLELRSPGARIGPEEGAKLSRHRQDQQRVTRTIENAAAEMDRILEKMATNKVGEQKEKDWLDRIRTELQQKAGSESGAVEKKIQDARDQAKTNPQQAAGLNPLLDEQRQIERELSTLALRLREFGDLNAIIQQWRGIQRRQTEIRDRVREEIRKESGAR